MNETIAALIQALKEEEVYRQYNVCLRELNNHHELLAAYQKAKQEYMDMRPYFKYQDFSDLKARVQQLSSELTQLESGKSMIRYFPPKGTAGLASFSVRA